MSEDKDVKDGLAKREEGPMSRYVWTKIGRITQVNVSTIQEDEEIIMKRGARMNGVYIEDFLTVHISSNRFPPPHSLM